MRKAAAVAGTGLFLLIAPGTVAGYVPWRITHWKVEATALRTIPFRGFGALLVAAATCILVDSFLRFAIKGLGTPAVPLPPRYLVVSGLYRYVRNPMYIAIAAAIFGQALLFSNLMLVAYGAAVWLFFHLFVIGYEEPSLRARFGEQYREFCGAVPRWIPRLRPWPGRSAEVQSGP